MFCISTLTYEQELVFVSIKKNKKQVKSSKVDLRLKNTKSKTHLIPLGDENSDLDVEDADDEITPPERKMRTRGRRFTSTGMRSNSYSSSYSQKQFFYYLFCLEVSTYTSTRELRRFWEYYDVRLVRDKNISRDSSGRIVAKLILELRRYKMIFILIK